MPDLITLPKGSPGRRQTVTARAWISRPATGRRAIFQSHVSLGDGKVFTLTTATPRRSKALDFNRSHLLAKLFLVGERSPDAASLVQGDFLNAEMLKS